MGPKLEPDSLQRDPMNDDDDSSLSYQRRTISEVTYSLLAVPSFSSLQGIGYFGCLVHVLKGVIGTGVFAMGSAIFNSGLMAGPIATVVVAIINLHCTYLLLKRSEEIFDDTGVYEASYGKVGEYVFLQGPTRAKKFSVMARIAINICIFIMKLGICCVYLGFVSNNMKQVLDHWWEQHIRIHFLLWTVPIMVISWIPNLKYLIPVVMLGNMFQIFGLVTVVYFCCMDIPKPTSSTHYYVAPLLSWPLFFGVANFAFEINSMALTLKASMRRPESFQGVCGVLNVGIYITTLMLIMVGTLGYIKYGEEVKGSLTLNLPTNSTLTLVVQVSLATAMLLSYPLHMFIAVAIIFPLLKMRWGPWRRELLVELVVRSSIVLFTALLAQTITQLDLVIALVGCICGTAISILIPAILDLVYCCHNGLGCCHWKLCRDIMIFIVGITGLFSGLYSVAYDTIRVK